MSTLLNELLVSRGLVLESEDSSTVSDQQDQTLAEAVVADVKEIDEAVEEHETASETVEALESLALTLESTLQSGRGYTALEMALHHSAVSAHYKLLGLAAPVSPSLESFASPASREQCSTLALESLLDTIKRAVVALCEFVKGLCGKVSDYVKKVIDKIRSSQSNVNSELDSNVSKEAFWSKPSTVDVKMLFGVRKQDYLDGIDAAVLLVAAFCSGRDGAVLFTLRQIAEKADLAVKGERTWNDGEDIKFFSIPQSLSRVLPGHPEIAYRGKNGAYEEINFRHSCRSGKVPVISSYDGTILLRRLDGLVDPLNGFCDNFNTALDKIYGTLNRLEKEVHNNVNTKLVLDDIKSIRGDINLGLHSTRIVFEYIDGLYDDYLAVGKAALK